MRIFRKTRSMTSVGTQCHVQGSKKSEDRIKFVGLIRFLGHIFIAQKDFEIVI